MTWSLVYLDGSTNAYRITSDGSFEYDPVTPERSSTGRYSGGEPWRAQLDATVLADLLQRARELEANRALHTPDRAKGTGAFTLQNDAGARSFILERGPELLQFDGFVAALGKT